jgi:hypothetical protein
MTCSNRLSQALSTPKVCLNPLCSIKSWLTTTTLSVMLRRQMEWVARVKNLEPRLQRPKILWKSLWKMNLKRIRVSPQFIKELKTGQSTRMFKLKKSLHLSFLWRKRKLLQLRLQVPVLQEKAEFSLTLLIQTSRLQQALLQQYLHQMDFSSQTMVGFADNAKITISLVELTVTGVRSVKI